MVPVARSAHDAPASPGKAQARRVHGRGRRVPRQRPAGVVGARAREHQRLLDLGMGGALVAPLRSHRPPRSQQRQHPRRRDGRDPATLRDRTRAGAPRAAPWLPARKPYPPGLCSRQQGCGDRGARRCARRLRRRRVPRRRVAPGRGLGRAAPGERRLLDPEPGDRSPRRLELGRLPAHTQLELSPGHPSQGAEAPPGARRGLQAFCRGATGWERTSRRSSRCTQNAGRRRARSTTRRRLRSTATSRPSPSRTDGSASGSSRSTGSPQPRGTATASRASKPITRPAVGWGTTTRRSE